MAGRRDTIFAPATARGRSAVAVVRASGPGADAALEALIGPLPDPRQAALRAVHDPESGEILDRALVLRFADGASFTGENSFEIQCHGGPAVVRAILAALARRDGLRLAEPGEFTRRALENGRMDLLEAEGLGDLVQAETEAQRRQALRALDGALGRQAEIWRGRLIRARALLEAVMDFADEEVPEDVGPEVSALVSATLDEMRAALSGAAAAERIRDGFEVALIGPPNAGKSTLLNALARREAAITSEIAGTTRDVIEVQMDLHGLPVLLLDTAGLREARDEIERIGIARARRRAEAADLRVLVTSPDTDDPGDVAADIRVLAKRELGGGDAGDFAVSAVTGAGMDAFVEAIAARLEAQAEGASAVVTERHRRALEGGRDQMTEALAHLEVGEAALDLAAEALRLAARRMEALTGRVDAERILDDIFSEFCLGK